MTKFTWNGENNKLEIKKFLTTNGISKVDIHIVENKYLIIDALILLDPVFMKKGESFYVDDYLNIKVDPITIVSEIEYINEKGLSIHSDLDFDIKLIKDDEYKKFLHDCLDEWFDKSNGTGGFYVRHPEHVFDIPSKFWDFYNKVYNENVRRLQDKNLLSDHYKGRISMLNEILEVLNVQENNIRIDD